jgi:subtilase family serine protease
MTPQPHKRELARRPQRFIPAGRRGWWWLAGGMAAAAAAATVGMTAGASGGAAPGRPVRMPPRLPACLTASRVPCEGQDPLHRAYGLGQLYARGVTGAGMTVAVIDDGADPWLRADLAVFDRFFRLPAARLRVAAWGPGAPGPVDPAAAREDAGDLELIHFIAPGARLVDVQVRPGPGLGQAARAIAALAAVTARGHVDVVSLSWGIPETVIPRAALPALRAGLATAAGHHVSVVAATGDSGPTWPGMHQCTVAWPASDPLVTAVGAIIPQVTAAGQVRGGTVAGGADATGAGLSALFARPAYQDSVTGVVGDRRGVADVSMDCAMWVYARIPGQVDAPGWFPACGTSLAAPMFAGIIALAAERAGHPLGLLNPLLYQVHGPGDGITDVTQGTNTSHGVPGYPARRGYDLSSGIGTIGSAPAFIAALLRPPARQGSAARP